MGVQVDKGVPMPPKKYPPKKDKWPWTELEVGDSFFMKGAKRGTAYAVALNASRRLGRKFSVRQVDGGYCVWRIA